MSIIKEIVFATDKILQREKTFSLLVIIGFVTVFLAAKEYKDSVYQIYIIAFAFVIAFLGVIGIFYDLLKNNAVSENDDPENIETIGIDEIKELITEIRPSININTNEGTKADLIKEITESVKSIQNSVSKKNETSELSSINKLVRNLYLAQNRLKAEVSQVEKRSTTNLIFGTIISLIGISVIGWVVFSIDQNNTKWQEQLSQHGPRVVLGIAIEIFAFFYLNLYKGGLVEIRYYQNEITNLNAKYTALKVSIFSNDIELKKIVITELVKTERNFILEKGQSTTEIRKEEVIANANAQSFKTLSDFFSKFQSK